MEPCCFELTKLVARIAIRYPVIRTYYVAAWMKKKHTYSSGSWCSLPGCYLATRVYILIIIVFIETTPHGQAVIYSTRFFLSPLVNVSNELISFDVYKITKPL